MKKQYLCLAMLASGLLSAHSAEACLTIPTPARIITSIYGWRYHPTLHYWRMHRGDDMRAPVQTTLLAAQDGTVQIASSASGGNELRILGSGGVVARYLHLTRALVSPGSKVTAGQNIALSGNTGNESAAAHLHFEVYQSGHDVNPEGMMCAGLSRKPGADMSDGFPVKACKPDGACSNQAHPLPAASGGSTTTGSGGSAQSGGGSTTTAGGSTPSSGGSSPTTATDQPPPPAPDVSQFDDMSTMEIYSSEVTKRFANPDWYKETAERSSIPLIIDYLHMTALGQSIRLQKKFLWSRIEMLLSTRLARRNRQDMEDRLARQRQAAAVAPGGK